MSQYKPYPKYKDSGVEWLGDVPEGWIVTSLKRYCNVTDGSHHSPKVQDIGFPFISVTDVGHNNINFKNCKKILEQDFKRLIKEGCQPNIGDILLTKDGTIGRAVIVKKNYPDFVILSSLGLLSPHKKLLNTYLYYYLLSGINIDQMNSMIHGSALKRMTISKIDNLIISFPSLKEQKEIANYLNQKTQKIDTLIEKQQTLINLLKEKRKTVIIHTVTKGLDSSVDMKDSEIEWLGDVPEHWKISKLKFFARIKNGQDQKKVISDNGKYPIYGSGGEFGRANNYLYNKVSVLLGRKGTVDKPLFITKPFWTVDTMYFTKINSQTNPKYFYYSCLTIPFGYYQYGSALPSMTQEDLHNHHFIAPPLKEQKEIANYLDQKTQKIDTLIEKATKAIKLLKERRTALISAVVTGKIDIQN